MKLNQRRANSRSRSATSKRILIVEDSRVGARAIACLLDSLGFQFDIASDGEQALKQIGFRDYVLVLMDLRLPAQDGFTVAKTIRSDENNVPIIALSAYPLKSDWQACVEAGIDDFLCKGFRKDELEKVIKLWANSGIVKSVLPSFRDTGITGRAVVPAVRC